MAQIKNEYIDKIRNTKFDTDDIVVRGSPVSEWNLKVQLKRLNEAMKSYLLLVDNNCLADAILIAGHIMETCAIISYISGTENNARKYVAKSTLHGLYDILEYDNTNLQQENINDAFSDGLPVIESNGYLAIKAEKNRKKANETHIKYLKDPKISNANKKKCIDNFYESLSAEDYLCPFRKKIVEHHIKNAPSEINLDRQFVLFYGEYCKIKHSNANLYSLKQIEPNKFIINNDAYDDVILSAIPVLLCLDLVKTILNK